jgi:hypothetical protein
MVKFIYRKNTLYVSIIDSDFQTTIRRTYRHTTIMERKVEKDLWGFCTDCADEIKGAIRGNHK